MTKVSGIRTAARAIAEALPVPVEAEPSRRIYVYLNDGGVKEVEGATGVSFLDHEREMVVLGGDHVLASFPRDTFYFAGFHRIAPPILF